jgi:hypothetical protein
MKDPIPSNRSSKNNFDSVLRNIKKGLTRIERINDPNDDVFYNKDIFGSHSDERRLIRLLDSEHLPKSNCDDIDEDFYIIYDRFCKLCELYVVEQNYKEEHNEKIKNIFTNIQKYYKYNKGRKGEIVEMLFEFKHITGIDLMYYPNEEEWDELVEEYVSKDLVVSLGLTS